MSQAPRSEALIHQVQWRLRLVSLVWATFWSFLAAWIVYTAAFLASRLGGVWVGFFTWESLAVIPAAAFLGGLLFHHRPRLADTARLVDQVSDSKDLYLTLVLLNTSAGEYQPLVVQSAEERAVKIQPGSVIRRRFQHWKPLWVWLTATAVPNLMLVLAMLMFLLPQLDPFGVVQAAQREQKKQERLAESRKATQLRLEVVKKEMEEAAKHSETEQAIQDLKQAFNNMQPHETQDNQKSLMAEQRKLGEKWRQLSADKLKDLLKQGSLSDQAFGKTDEDLLRKLTKELQEGKTDGVQREMNQAMKDLRDLKEQLEKLAKADTPEEKAAAEQKAAELERTLKERLDKLNELAQKRLNNDQLTAALQRAMQQLDAARNPKLMEEALESLEESLELSELELQEIAQSAKDMKSLEEALKTIQMAKKLNEQEKLDGEQCKKCKSLKDYEELYQQLLAELGEGEGEGLGNRGQGRGGKAPEDDSVHSDFQSEYSQSQVQAGKVLLSLKTQGEGKEGDVVKNYRTLINQVKQGVSEAIVLEQVPPGYHDGIKSYFDSLEPVNGK
jgi:hypothetical protein